MDGPAPAAVAAVSAERADAGCIGRNHRGAAIPIVLVIATLITVIAVSITVFIRQQIDITREIRLRSIASLKAHSALSDVLFRMCTGYFEPYAMAFWENDGKLVRWNLYGEAVNLPGDVVLKLRDLSGMFSPLFQAQDLEVLSRPQIPSFSFQKDAYWLDKLLDWQDADDFRRVNGAEAFDYRRAGLAYVPRNFYIQCLDELYLLKDVDPKLWETIWPEMVYWRPGPTNFLTMDEAALRTILKNDSQVQSILQQREQRVLTPWVFQGLTGIRPSEDVVFQTYGWIRVAIEAREETAVERIDVTVIKGGRQGGPYWVAEWKR